MRICIEGNVGSGKCLGYGQFVLMHSGAIKQAQDIVVGDKLMGEDSKPRAVLALCSGREELFRIVSPDGNGFTATRNHVLCLKAAEHKVVELTVGDYMQAGKQALSDYTSAVELPHRQPQFNPWVLGLWLGCGHDSSPGFTTSDSVLAKRIASVLGPMCCSPGPAGVSTFRSLPLKTALRQLNMLGARHVPPQLIYTSVRVRRAFIAGWVDGKGGFAFTEHDQRVIAGIVLLSRSLGLACRSDAAANTFVIGTSQVDGPVVESIGEGLYYGFETDGNHRFLLDDFTVTHNSTVLTSIQNSWPGVIVQEPVNEWSHFLELFYQQPSRWALALNLQVLLHYATIPCGGRFPIIVERSPLSCKEVFGRALVNEGTMNTREWQLFCDLHQTIAWIPDVIIYLDSTPAMCMERVRKRGRTEEVHLTEEYLSKLQFAHTTMFRWSQSKVYTVDATQNAQDVSAQVCGILETYINEGDHDATPNLET